MKKFIPLIFIFLIAIGCGGGGGSDPVNTDDDGTISTTDTSSLTNAIKIDGTTVSGELPASSGSGAPVITTDAADIETTAGEEVQIPVFYSSSSKAASSSGIYRIYVQIKGSSSYWLVTKFTSASGVVYFSFTMPESVKAGDFTLVIKIENTDSKISIAVEKTVTVSRPSTVILPSGVWGNSGFIFKNNGDDDTQGTDDDEWEKETLIISGNIFTYTCEFSSGADAEHLTPTGKLLYTGTLATGAAATTPSGASKIDITQTSATMTLLNSSAVTWANTYSYYGYTDWVINTAKDIAGRTDDEGETEDTNGTVWYQVFKIVDNTLYLGDDEADSNYDGSTDAKRPQVFCSDTYSVISYSDLIEGTWGDSDYVWYNNGDDEIYGTDDDGWGKNTIIISGSSFTLTHMMAEGTDIDNLTPIVKYESTNTFVTGDAVTIPSGARKINITQTSVTMTILDSYPVTWANNYGYYGYTDWVLNTPKDIAGRTDEEGKTENANGTIRYSVFKLVGNSLYLGDDEADSNYDGSTDAKRPLVLESYYYLKLSE